MNSEDFELQIIISSGKNMPEKAILGLATALSAASVDTRVVIFLTMDGAIWADPKEGFEKYVPYFESPSYYIEHMSELDVVFEACTSCVHNCCPDLFKEEGKNNMRPGFQLAGLSTAAIRATKVNTLTF